MSIRLYIFLFFLAIECKSPPTTNDKLSQRINHLLNITESEKKFNNILETYISSDPNLSIFKSNIMSFIEKFLSFKSLRPHIIQIYRDLYTLTDINGLIKFYSSSLGKKLLEKESKTEIRLSQLIKTQIEKQIPQMISWFQQELNKDYSKNQTLH